MGESDAGNQHPGQHPSSGQRQRCLKTQSLLNARIRSIPNQVKTLRTTSRSRIPVRDPQSVTMFNLLTLRSPPRGCGPEMRMRRPRAVEGMQLSSRNAHLILMPISCFRSPMSDFCSRPHRKPHFQTETLESASGTSLTAVRNVLVLSVPC
jgi:hypothetical protein